MNQTPNAELPEDFPRRVMQAARAEKRRRRFRRRSAATAILFVAAALVPLAKFILPSAARPPVRPGWTAEAAYQALSNQMAQETTPAVGQYLLPDSAAVSYFTG